MNCHDQADRRRFLAFAGLAPFVMLTGAGAGAADLAACYDPAALPLAQKRQRRAIGYVELSTDRAKRCNLCAFYTAAASQGCGTCQMLTGGPVKGVALCNSFAPKAA